MIYVVEQHNIGLGHLTRSKLIAEALRTLGPVTLVIGGQVPNDNVWPLGIRVVPLEPLTRDSKTPGLNVPVHPQADIALVPE